MNVEIGQVAPDFTLYSTEKSKVALNSFRGKTVVLAFYPGAFTGPCDREVCALQESLSRFNGMNAEVVGISVDSPFANKEFATKYKLEFTLLSDFDREVINLYGVLFKGLGGVEGYNVANRAIVILDKEGIVRYTWEAQPNPGVEPNYSELEEVVGKL